MAVMVTGTGFVGSYVVRDLLAAGEKVVLYGYYGGNGDKANYDLPDLNFLSDLVGGDLRDKVQIEIGDITDLSAVDGAVEKHGVRSIIHLASKVTAATHANPTSAVRVNAEGTANMFEAAARHELDKVVFASSIAVYGPKSIQASGYITDESVYDPRDVYGATKLLCEQLAMNYAESRGVDITGLRLSRVFGFGEHIRAGRGGGSSWLTRLFHDAAVGEPGVVVPFGEKDFDFHYVEDVSDAFLRALHHKSTDGQTYLTHGDFRSVAAAFDFVRDLLPSAEMTLTTGSADLPPGHSVAWERRYDASKAEAALGIRSRFSMEAGAFRTINLNRQFAGLEELPVPTGLLSLNG